MAVAEETPCVEPTTIAVDTAAATTATPSHLSRSLQFMARRTPQCRYYLFRLGCVAFFTCANRCSRVGVCWGFELANRAKPCCKYTWRSMPSLPTKIKPLLDPFCPYRCVVLLTFYGAKAIGRWQRWWPAQAWRAEVSVSEPASLWVGNCYRRRL